MTTPRAAHLLRAARGTARVWAEFIQAYTKDPEQLYGFFEGQDDPKYYNQHIRSIVFRHREIKYHYFWCEGKQSVIQVWELLTNNTHYQRAWVAFFLDRDFDAREELPDDPRVFITPCYAIENLYVHQSLVEQVLRDEFALTHTDQDFQQTITLFHVLLDRFNDASEELNAWLYVHRQREKTTGTASTIRMQNLSDEQLFKITLHEVTMTWTLADIITRFPHAPTINQDEIDHQITVFRMGDRTMQFRGKHLLFFLRTFLMRLVEDRGRKKGRVHFTERGRTNLHLSHNVLSELSQYADTPSSLCDFLERCAGDRPGQRELAL